MTYTIKIEGMEFRAGHGCNEAEQRVGGNFTVDVALEVDDDGAVVRDELEGTVDYVAVYEIVREQMATPSRIIEHAADRIVKAIKASFPQVRRAELTISKLAPPLGGKALKTSVTIVG